MKRIMFVDDEELVLNGLRNLLRHKRRDWDMVFAHGGEAALLALEQGGFDVVVTDMRMPRVDGARVLERVRKDHPSTARIVLSGFADADSALRTVQVAHQFLTKPCDPKILENVIERTCKLQMLIAEGAVRKAVARMDKLPPVPRVYAALSQALQQPDVNLRAVTRLVEKDLALTTKLLQMVNSAFFRLAKRVTSIEQAVTYLGFNTLKNLVLSTEVFSTGLLKTIPGFSLERVQRHGVLVGSVASQLLPEKPQSDDAFLAGMLHDIGKVLLAMSVENYGEILEQAKAQSLPVYQVEQQVLGVTHAEVGAYLLGLWGLPYSVVEAVAHHHVPDRVEALRFDVLAALHAADALVNSLIKTASPTPMNDNYVAKFATPEVLSEWKSVATREKKRLERI